MTPLAAVGVALAVLLAGLTAAIGDASARRMSAQVAADAAALAAAAESAPYGRGDPMGRARAFARANDAALVECDCDPGAVEFEVEVVRDGIHARARAVLDVDRLGPLWLGADARELHPRLAAALDRLLRAGRGAVRLVSGYRSPAAQRGLWREALQKYGTPEAADDWVAPPGRSMHERGLAIDLGGDLELAERLVDELGLPLHRPLPNEPWHFELLGSRD